MEVQVLITGIRYPIQMTQDAVGEAMSPSAHQDWTYNH